jgi:predicted nucleotidyltransferase
MDEFTYDDLVDGLRAVIARIQRTELRGATIQIVGGAALRLAYFERSATVDVDARIVPADEIESIADQLADERGWSSGWLNHNASQFVPAWGRSIEWVTLFADDSVTVEGAPVDALLAMKLLAAAGRPDLQPEY